MCNIKIHRWSGARDVVVQPRDACALQGVCEHKVRSIGMCVRACVCTNVVPPDRRRAIARTWQARRRAGGEQTSGDRATDRPRARAGWLADEIWQQRFCFRHGLTSAAGLPRARQTGQPPPSLRLYILLSSRCVKRQWRLAARDRNRK